MVALATIAGGCSEEDTGTTRVQPTQIVVFPEDFLGEVECSARDGAAHAYVATLIMWDDELDVEPFRLGSSYPTPCGRPVAYQKVLTPGKLYTAEVDIYDVFADQLAPFGSRSSGARRMEDPETGTVVEPRWTTACGTGPSQATMALENQSHPIRHCAPLSREETGVTAVAVPPAAVLGADPCATAATFDVEPLDGALSPTGGAACDGEAVVYDQGITPGRGYSFYATTRIEQTLYGALCQATARLGVTATVQCGALRSDGDVYISLAGLMAGEQELCPAGYRYDVTLGDEILNAAPLPCRGQAQIGPLAPGDYALSVTVVDDRGQTTGGASCTATVVAGQAVQASCTPLP